MSRTLSVHTCLLAVAGFTQWAWTEGVPPEGAIREVQLSGVIQDIHQKPVQGIVVSVASMGLADTSDADGKWSLESSLSGRALPSPASRIHWDGRKLSLPLGAPARVELAVFDAQGARVGGLSPRRLDAGPHHLEVPGYRSGSGIHWLRVSIDGKTQVLPLGIQSAGESVAQDLAGGRTMASAAGTLTYSWQGDTICSRDLDSMRHTGIRQILRKIHFTTEAYPDPDTPADSLVAVVELGKTSPSRRFGLRYTSRDSILPGNGVFLRGRISGNAYLPADSALAQVRLRAWIHVLGNGLRRIGLSDTAMLPHEADTLRFDSTLHMSNALPRGAIRCDTIQLVRTNYDLKLDMERRHKLPIAKIEWDVDGRGYQVGSLTRSVKWSWPGRTMYDVRSRITDVDGNVHHCGKKIQLLPIDSMGKLSDRTVLAGENVVFDVFVADTNGLAMTIWNFGDGIRDTVYGGPYVAANHTYPVIPSSGSDVSKVYTLTATKVDGKGFRDSSSAKITVTNPLPSFHATNTVGEVGTRLLLHLVSRNAGKLAGVEWGIGSSDLVAGKADTLIELPKIPTEKYLVRVRVTDERGNVSPVDTVWVRVREAVRMTDPRDGQQYRIVTIGTQTWMAQNLNFRQATGTKDTFGICMEHDPAHCAKFGRLYDWPEAMGLDSTYWTKSWPGSSAKRQGICPQGWHVPSKAEWRTLINAAGGETVAGTRLKSTGDWNDDCKECGIGTDDFWFSGLPGGSYEVGWGDWLPIGNNAYWWSATQDDSTYVTDFRADYLATWLIYSASAKVNHESLRCLKD